MSYQQKIDDMFNFFKLNRKRMIGDKQAKRNKVQSEIEKDQLIAEILIDFFKDCVNYANHSLPNIKIKREEKQKGFHTFSIEEICLPSGRQNGIQQPHQQQYASQQPIRSTYYNNQQNNQVIVPEQRKSASNIVPNNYGKQAVDKQQQISSEKDRKYKDEPGDNRLYTQEERKQISSHRSSNRSEKDQIKAQNHRREHSPLQQQQKQKPYSQIVEPEKSEIEINVVPQQMIPQSQGQIRSNVKDNVKSNQGPKPAINLKIDRNRNLPCFQLGNEQFPKLDTIFAKFFVRLQVPKYEAGLLSELQNSNFNLSEVDISNSFQDVNDSAIYKEPEFNKVISFKSWFNMEQKGGLQQEQLIGANYLEKEKNAFESRSVKSDLMTKPNTEDTTSQNEVQLYERVYDARYQNPFSQQKSQPKTSIQHNNDLNDSNPFSKEKILQSYNHKNFLQGSSNLQQESASKTVSQVQQFQSQQQLKQQLISQQEMKLNQAPYYNPIPQQENNKQVLPIAQQVAQKFEESQAVINQSSFKDVNMSMMASSRMDNNYNEECDLSKSFTKEAIDKLLVEKQKHEKSFFHDSDEEEKNDSQNGEDGESEDEEEADSIKSALTPDDYQKIARGTCSLQGVQKLVEYLETSNSFFYYAVKDFFVDEVKGYYLQRDDNSHILIRKYQSKKLEDKNQGISKENAIAIIKKTVSDPSFISSKIKFKE